MQTGRVSPISVRPDRKPLGAARPDVAASARLGKQARHGTPRSRQATFTVDADRADPITLLEQQGRSRVAELLPIRYGRMVSSPFAFFRGAALIMAADLARTPTTGLRVQLCGDAHLSNFGVFASPERQLIFDLNDFDETLAGPWEWDVKRFVASVEVAARTNGIDIAARRAILLSAARQYREAMAMFAQSSNLAVWYAHQAVEPALAEHRAELGPRTTRRAQALIEKARTRDHLQAFAKLVRTVDGEPRFISDPPLLVPVAELPAVDHPADVESRIEAAMRGYRSSLSADRRQLLDQYRPVQLARKVVGVGSVGTRVWVLLMMGRDDADPLILQIKEAQASVLEGFLARSGYANAGHRVVAGQRAIQASSDIFLGWQRAYLDGAERDFYVRQLRDWKGSVEVDQLDAAALLHYAGLCAWTLARAHARTGDRYALAAYLGPGDVFDRAVADFAGVYADQNEKDHAALQDAVASGRVPATLGI